MLFAANDCLVLLGQSVEQDFAGAGYDDGAPKCGFAHLALGIPNHVFQDVATLDAEDVTGSSDCRLQGNPVITRKCLKNLGRDQ